MTSMQYNGESNKKLSFHPFQNLHLKYLLPARSAVSERVYSLTGNLITSKRNRLARKIVDNIIFLNSIFKT